MTRGKFLLGAVPAALALSITPAMAQRSASGGEATGSAVSRGGGDGGGAVSRGGGEGSSSSSTSSSSGSGSSSSGSSGYSTPSSSGSSSTREYVTAPSRPSERGAQRRGGGDGESSGRAVPRGGGSSGGSSDSTRATAPSSSGSRTSSPADRAVPEYSRPRGDRPAQGTAVERRPGNVPGEVLIPRYYNPYLYGRSYWPGYAFGLGYYYDSLWYDPYGYGGFGGYGGYVDPYGGVASGRGSYDRVGTGSVRLKIKPNDAQVYVDGYFVGTVDEFDGMFQKLTIDAGTHKIEIRAEGHEVTAFDVLITPGETVTFKGDLKRIQ
jgi:hypothetical protein